jgi:hypothetical protein
MFTVVFTTKDTMDTKGKTIRKKTNLSLVSFVSFVVNDTDYEGRA